MVRIFVLMVGLPTIALSQGSLTVKLSNFKGKASCFGVALYQESGFLDEEQALLTDYLCNNDNLAESQFQIVDGLPVGKYALAVFEDLNKNRKLDKNLTGIPIEPYVFSNNVGSKWSKPTFSAASFQLDIGTNHLDLELKYWKEY